MMMTETKPPAIRLSHRWSRLRARWIVGALALLALIPAGYWALAVFCGKNIHVVIPGRVFRGAQLSVADLEQLVKQHKIRTIVNLRGCCDKIPWYINECRLAQRLNLNQEDIGLSAYRFPNTTELRELVEVLERAEYPIYLHCRRGADRTGMAAAAVLLMQAGVPPADAFRQLSVRYGHVAIGAASFLDHFLGIYSAWLAETAQEHSPERFRHWALNEYKGGWHQCRFANFRHGDLRASEHIVCQVEAHNNGLKEWHMHTVRAAGMHLNYCVRDERDDDVASGSVGLFEAVVPVGKKVDLQFALPPLPAGRYQLFATMEDARNFHLYQTGSEPLEVEFEVR